MGRCPPVRVQSRTKHRHSGTRYAASPESKITKRKAQLFGANPALAVVGIPGLAVAIRNNGAQPPRGAFASRTSNQIGTTITAPSKK